MEYKYLKAMLTLINSYFWKSFFGPFFAFIFPLIFVAILGTMLGYNELFGGTLAISSMSVALTSMPQTIFEFKRSSLLKRIGVTPIKPWMFLLIISGFYFLVMIISTFWVVGISSLIFIGNWDVGRVISDKLVGTETINILAPSLSNIFANVNWGGFIFSIITNIIVGISVGFVLVSFAKTSIFIQAIGIPILIISQFLSAQVLPIDMVKSSEFMWYLSYLSPFKYSTGMMIESWGGIPGAPILDGTNIQTIINGVSNPFNLNQIYEILDPNGKGNNIEIFNFTDKLLNILMPFIFSGVFYTISLKFFKWSAR
ncbi:MAG: hypothetical protein ACRCRZ_02685 [Metamycoplasmataceae bacterium]